MKLKCALISDTHKGASNKTDMIHHGFFKKLAAENIDVLFWAGDLISHKQEQLESTLKMARHYLPNTMIILCLGNHDLWQFEHFKISKRDALDRDVTHKLSAYSRPMPYSKMIEKHKELFTKYNMIHLDGTSFEINEKVVAIGYNGWYSETDISKLQTNDSLYLPPKIEGLPAHEFLRNKAETDLQKILDIPTNGKIVIGMTHMPPFTKEKPIQDPNLEEKWNANGRFLDFLTDKCDYLLVGHSHKYIDVTYNDCRILNCGPDYNKPTYTIFEIE